MTKTMVLYGRRAGAQAEAGEVKVPWAEAENFHEAASHLISGTYENAIIIPVNSTPGYAQTAAVRITIDHNSTNFKGFAAHLWLGDKPYEEKDPIDFDWVAYIPCQ